MQASVRADEARMKLSVYRCATAALAVLLSMSALVPAPARAAEKTAVVALVASAASKAMAEIIPLYEKSHPDVTIQPQFAGAQVLRAQVDSGAGDVIVVGSSSIGILGGKVENAVSLFKYHEVVEVPKGSSKVHGLKDLATKGVRIVLGTADSPHGGYARSVIEKAGKSYGAAFAPAVLANVVTTKTASQGVPQAVLAGSVDAGIGFSSDEYPGLTLINVPAEFDVVTTTQGAVVKSSPHQSAAKDFVSFLSGSEAQAIFRKHHFD
jgi:molybdate transport system substrate-binding protein